MGRGAGGDCGLERWCVPHSGRPARFPAKTSQRVQASACHRVFERTSSQDRNRQDPQKRTARAVLGWNGKCQAGSGLMVFVRLENLDELATLRLWEAGTLGITEGDGYVDAFFEDADVASQFGVPEAVVDVDWVAQTQASFPPLLVGEKFFVAAPWRTEPTPPGRIRLVINPGSQCGTGYHRCTQLCLEAMEKLV